MFVGFGANDIRVSASHLQATFTNLAAQGFLKKTESHLSNLASLTSLLITKTFLFTLISNVIYCDVYQYN